MAATNTTAKKNCEIHLCEKDSGENRADYRAEARPAAR